MKSIRLARRLLFFLLYTAVIVAEVSLRKAVLGQKVPALMAVRRRWARNLLPGIGIQLKIRGDVPTGCCIVVSNHRAHLDPLLVLRDVDGYPVAKAEIADWPLIGTGGRMAGMLFVQRDDPGSRMTTVRAIVKVLQAGFPLIIFPEGDTSDLDGTLPFKRAVFEIAARLHIPVVPVALIFADARDCWVAQEHFMKHAMRRFDQKKVRMEVHYGPPVQGNNAQQLMETAKHWIDQQLRQHPMQRIN